MPFDGKRQESSYGRSPVFEPGNVDEMPPLDVRSHTAKLGIRLKSVHLVNSLPHYRRMGARIQPSTIPYFENIVVPLKSKHKELSETFTSTDRRSVGHSKKISTRTSLPYVSDVRVTSYQQVPPYYADHIPPMSSWERKERLHTSTLWTLPNQPIRLENEMMALSNCRSLKRTAEKLPHRVDQSYFMTGSQKKIHTRYEITDDEIKIFQKLTRAQGHSRVVTPSARSAPPGGARSSCRKSERTPRREDLCQSVPPGRGSDIVMDDEQTVQELLRSDLDAREAVSFDATSERSSVTNEWPQVKSEEMKETANQNYTTDNIDENTEEVVQVDEINELLDRELSASQADEHKNKNEDLILTDQNEKIIEESDEDSVDVSKGIEKDDKQIVEDSNIMEGSGEVNMLETNTLANRDTTPTNNLNEPGHKGIKQPKSSISQRSLSEIKKSAKGEVPEMNNLEESKVIQSCNLSEKQPEDKDKRHIQADSQQGHVGAPVGYVSENNTGVESRKGSSHVDSGKSVSPILSQSKTKSATGKRVSIGEEGKSKRVQFSLQNAASPISSVQETQKLSRESTIQDLKSPRTVSQLSQEESTSSNVETLESPATPIFRVTSDGVKCTKEDVTGLSFTEQNDKDPDSSDDDSDDDTDDFTPDQWEGKLLQGKRKKGGLRGSYLRSENKLSSLRANTRHLNAKPNPNHSWVLDDVYSFVSPEKKTIYEKHFLSLDTDNSGSISRDELHSRLFQNSTQRDLDLFLKVFDVNNDNMVDVMEFVTVAALNDKLCGNKTNDDSGPLKLDLPKLAYHMAAFKEMFELLDTDGDRSLSIEELMLMITVGISEQIGTDKPLLDLIIKTVDRDHSGRIEFVEFLTFIPFFLGIHSHLLKKPVLIEDIEMARHAVRRALKPRQQYRRHFKEKTKDIWQD